MIYEGGWPYNPEKDSGPGANVTFEVGKKYPRISLITWLTCTTSLVAAT